MLTLVLLTIFFIKKERIKKEVYDLVIKIMFDANQYLAIVISLFISSFKPLYGALFLLIFNMFRQRVQCDVGA